MPTGGFTGCVIVWERYGFDVGQTRFRDGKERGIVTCQEHDVCVDYAVTRDEPRPDVCERGEAEDE